MPSRGAPPGMKERRPKAVSRATRTPGEQDREHERDDGDDHVTRWTAEPRASGGRSAATSSEERVMPAESQHLPGQPRWEQTWGDMSCGCPSELGEQQPSPSPSSAEMADSTGRRFVERINPSWTPASGSSGWGGAGSAAGRRARSAPAVCAVTACWTLSWIRLLPSPRACRHGRIGSRTMSGGSLESTPAPHPRWRHGMCVPHRVVSALRPTMPRRPDRR